jgi:hypothetical protein
VATWTVEYEQCPAEGLWVYKFDHEPNRDGAWHRLNAQAEGFYRFAGNMLQFVAPVRGLSETVFDEVMRRLAEAGPIETEDELEIEIRCDATHYEMWSHWLLSGAPPRFEELSAEALNDAYGRLRAAEDEEDTRGEAS